MTFDLFTIAWLVLGGVLILLEAVVPGLVIIFFGLSAVLVGLAAGLGLVSSLGAAVGLWALTSSALVLGVRSSMKRLSPGESERASTDEEVEAFGQRVLVVVAAAPNVEGRIRFQGTTWPARTVEEHLQVGSSARIVARDNLVWIVERDEDHFLGSGES